MKTIKNHFVLDIETINSKPCYFCGVREYSKTSGANQEAQPGNFMQHDDKYVIDIGYVRIFECSSCHQLLFFRSYHSEEIDLVESASL